MFEVLARGGGRDVSYRSEKGHICDLQFFIFQTHFTHFYLTHESGS